MSWQSRLRPAVLTLALTAVLAVFGACTAPMNTFDPQSDAAGVIYDLYILITILASAVGVLVLGIMAYVLIRYRARPGHQAKQIHGNTKLEIMWTLGPILVLIMIAVPTFIAIAGAARQPEPGALQVTAIGHQWWFEFRYDNIEGPDGQPLTTANELHIPHGRQVAITLESEDVIHSFWVPKLFGKQDMIPNRTNHLSPFEATEIGEYYGHCAEFCGAAHANMRFRVYVDSLGDFNEWVTALQSPAPEPEPGTDAAQGAQVFQLAGGCGACHTIYGTPAQGQVGPNLSLMGERNTVGAGIMPNTTDNLHDWIANVRDFKPIPEAGTRGGRFMPTFAQDELEEGGLSNGQIADLVAYLQSLTIENQTEGQQ